MAESGDSRAPSPDWIANAQDSVLIAVGVAGLFLVASGAFQDEMSALVGGLVAKAVSVGWFWRARRLRPAIDQFRLVEADPKAAAFVRAGGGRLFVWVSPVGRLKFSTVKP